MFSFFENRLLVFGLSYCRAIQAPHLIKLTAVVLLPQRTTAQIPPLEINLAQNVSPVPDDTIDTEGRLLRAVLELARSLGGSFLSLPRPLVAIRPAKLGPALVCNFNDG